MGNRANIGDGCDRGVRGNMGVRGDMGDRVNMVNGNDRSNKNQHVFI